MEKALKMGIFHGNSTKNGRFCVYFTPSEKETYHMGNWPRTGEEGQFGMKPLYFDTPIILLDILEKRNWFVTDKINMIAFPIKTKWFA